MLSFAESVAIVHFFRWIHNVGIKCENAYYKDIKFYFYFIIIWIHAEKCRSNHQQSEIKERRFRLTRWNGWGGENAENYSNDPICCGQAFTFNYHFSYRAASFFRLNSVFIIAIRLLCVQRAVERESNNFQSDVVVVLIFFLPMTFIFFYCCIFFHVLNRFYTLVYRKKIYQAAFCDAENSFFSSSMWQKELRQVLKKRAECKCLASWFMSMEENLV